MSKPSWINSLKDLLVPTRAPSEPFARVALVGIGSELNADDAAGPAVIRLLRPQLASHAHLLLIDAGQAPESFTGPLRRFQPDVILLVDAGHFDAAVGEVRLLAGQDVEGFSAATHGLPPSTLARFLTAELDCQVVILAIQAGMIEFDQPMTGEMETAVEQVSSHLVALLA